MDQLARPIEYRPQLVNKLNLSSWFISHGTVFFSHNKSANNTFEPVFSAKRTRPMCADEFWIIRVSRPIWSKVAEQIRSGVHVFRIAIMSPPLVMVIGYE